MGATTTQLTSLLAKLKEDHPTLSFVEGDAFLWSPDTQTITYTDTGTPDLLLHELAHATLEHAQYSRDIELLTMERAAWDAAKTLAKTYSVPISEAVAESHLDTYRDWLHARSTCPACTATGYQTSINTYTCPACTQSWKVNEARVCQLRRVKI